MRLRLPQAKDVFALRRWSEAIRLWPFLSGGVMVAQESLELFVMVRIHAGQPLPYRLDKEKRFLHVGGMPNGA